MRGSKRKDFLFVAHEAVGEALAGFYALVAACEVSDIIPEEYLADVLLCRNRPASDVAGGIAGVEVVVDPGWNGERQGRCRGRGFSRSAFAR